jgi:uncharacterized protein
LWRRRPAGGFFLGGYPNPPARRPSHKNHEPSKAQIFRAREFCEKFQRKRRGQTLKITEKDGALSFAVRVQPRASRDEIAGEYQDGLKVRLTAPPVDDRANQALCKLLAARLKLPLSAVRIAAGERSRAKRVEIRGATPEMIRALAG